MKITDSSAAKVGASNVSAIASSTALYRQFMVYSATTISSVISGTIGIIKNGTGTLTLIGSNTYTGATIINMGILRLTSSGAIFNGFTAPFTVNTNGTLSLGGADSDLKVGVNLDGGTLFSDQNSGFVVISPVVNVTINSIIQTSGTGTTTNLSQLYFDGGINISSGVTLTYNPTTLNSGIVVRNNASSSGSLVINGVGTGSTTGRSNLQFATAGSSNFANTDLTLTNATMNVGRGSNSDANSGATIKSLNGNGRVRADSTASTITVGANNGTGSFSGIIANGTATLTLVKSGSGTQTLLGNNTYTGTTTISGTLEIGSTGLLGNGSYSATVTNNGTFLFGSNSNQTLSGIISGTGVLTKSGTGTLITNAVNTYTGGTIVNAGTLQIGNGTNATARVLNTTTLSGGNLAYNYNANNFTVNGAITLTSTASLTKLGSFQINLQTGTLNGGGQTLNINATGVIYFNGTAGTTSLGQINILTGAVGQDGAGGLPLRNATINVSSGAQFRTYTSPTINNNITLNGGAGPNGGGALWNESVVAGHTPIYVGTITLASGTDSSVGNTTSGFSITGQISGSGSFTKVGTGMLTTYNQNNNYTGSTTISAGTLRVFAKTFGAISLTASFTTTSLTVDFNNVTPTTGATYQFFLGATSPTGLTVTLTNAGGKTGTYNYTNSTLTIN